MAGVIEQRGVVFVVVDDDGSETACLTVDEAAMMAGKAAYAAESSEANGNG